VPDDDGPGDPAEAEDAAYELLGHAVGALRPAPSAGGVAFFARTDLGRSRPAVDN